MNIARLTYIRNILRAMGINKLLTVHKSIRARKEINVFRDLKPARARLNVAGVYIELYTKDEQEWLRARSLVSDSHIIRAILNQLQSGDHYWDIGASIGGYANIMSKAVGSHGSVVAFEPELRSYEKLKSNTLLNDANNITALRIALGEKQETLGFILAENPSEGTHHLVSDSGNANDNALEIEVVPMDRLRESMDLEVPTVVKIDVEGWEEKVIVGGKETLSSPKCRAVVVEVHFAILAKLSDNQAPERIVGLLRDCHFTMFNWLDTSHLLASK